MTFFCAEQEAERKMLAALLEGEGEEERRKSSRRERAIADVAWMKHVIEQQLQLEREREAEFDHLHRWAPRFRQFWLPSSESAPKQNGGLSSDLGTKRSRCGRSKRRSGRKSEKPESDSCKRWTGFTFQLRISHRVKSLKADLCSSSWKGAGGETAAADDEDAEKPWGSGGVSEETRGADKGAGEGEDSQTAGERAAREPSDSVVTRDWCSGWIMAPLLESIKIQFPVITVIVGGGEAPGATGGAKEDRTGRGGGSRSSSRSRGTVEVGDTKDGGERTPGEGKLCWSTSH